jgi:predicted RND superfamily exporter protein
MNLYQRFIARGSTWIILSVLVLGGVAIYFLPGFSIEAGSDVLLNENDPDLAYYNKTRADWVSDEYVIVCCHRKEGWFSKEGLELLNSFTREVRRLPHVKNVVSMMTSVPLLRILPPNPIGPTPVWLVNSKTDELDPRVDLEKASDELLHHTQAVGNLISANGQDASVLVYLAIPDDLTTYEGERNQLLAHGGPGSRERLALIDPLYQKAKKDLDGWRIELIARLRAMTVDWGPKFDEPLRLSGLSFINILLVEHIRNDLWVFGILSFALFSLTFLVIYRRFRWVALPMITCVLPVAIMLALMVITGKKITIVTSNMPVLLFVLMLPYTVYYIERYNERRTLHAEEPGEVSATRAPIEIWLPCLYSCLAAMAGTLAHTPSGINPVRTFGWMMTIGVAIGLGIVMTLLPASVVKLKPLPGAPKGATAFFRGPLKLLETLVLRAPGSVVAFSLVVLGISIWGTSKITVETKFIDYFLKKSPIYQGLDYIDNRMGGTTPLEVILTSDKPGFFKTPEGLAALEASARFFDAVPETGNVRSFKTLVDEVKKAMAGMRTPSWWGSSTLRGAQTGVEVRRRAREVGGREGRDGGAARGGDADGRVQGAAGGESEARPHRSRSGRRILQLELHGVARARADEGDSADAQPRPHPRRPEGKPGLAQGHGAQGAGGAADGIFPSLNMLNTLHHRDAGRSSWPCAIFLMLCWLFRSPKLAILVLSRRSCRCSSWRDGLTGIALNMVTVVIASVAMGIGIDAAIQYRCASSWSWRRRAATFGGGAALARDDRPRDPHRHVDRLRGLHHPDVLDQAHDLVRDVHRLGHSHGSICISDNLASNFVLLKYPRK